LYLLDTNVVSDLRKAGTPTADSKLIEWASDIESGHLYISSITVLELEIGVQRLERRDKRQGKVLRSWLEDKVYPSFEGRVLPFCIDSAAYCAQLHVPDQRSDRDSFIASIAYVHDMTVATRNLRDFEGMGVSLVNPWAR